MWYHCFKSLWPSDAKWRHRSRSTLAQVMACCLASPRHYQNRCWLIIKGFHGILLRTIPLQSITITIRKMRLKIALLILFPHPHSKANLAIMGKWLMNLVKANYITTTKLTKICLFYGIWGKYRGFALTNRFHIVSHDDVIKWKHFPRYWSFLRGIRRWPVNSPHKGQWRRALMFFIWAWTNGWVTIKTPVIWDAIALIMTSLQCMTLVFPPYRFS